MKTNISPAGKRPQSPAAFARTPQPTSSPVAAGYRPAGAALAIAAAFSVIPNHGAAQPTGAQVIHGQASLARQGNSLVVTTQNGPGTNHSAINWQSFSVPGGSTTRFDQPSATSTSINRVLGNNPSAIFGTLSSNGRLVLVNASGITVGAGAVVDTAGFTASALRMSEADALSGRFVFGDGLPGGALKVDGQVLARSGDVVLIGSSVQVGADALVQAPNGATLLAAGQKVELTGRGLEGIRLELQAPGDQALNLGTLKGDAVGIFAGQLKHSGLIQATSATVSGGKVVLKGQDTADISGRINATRGEVGGQVHATANKVMLRSGAIIDVSGAQGGGEALIGGGWQGKDGRVANAQITTIESGATVRADAIQSGNGGTVVAWSDDTTRVHGSISARGGAAGGNGGAVETSGKRYLDFTGAADLRAPNGSAGTLLLDPSDITIQAAGPDSLTLAGSTPSFSYGAGSGSSILTTGTLSNQLGMGNVLVRTDTGTGATLGGRITVADAVTWTSGNALGLQADSDIFINAPIIGGPGSTLSLSAGNGGSGGITQTAAISATNLAIKALGDVYLDTVANSVTNVAASLGDVTQGSTNKVFRFRNSGALNVGSVAGISGVSSMFNDGGYDPSNPNGYISLVAAGPITQSPGALLGGKAVYAEGTSVTLDQPNWTGVIAGRATGTGVFSYKSANPISVNYVAGNFGIHAGANIKLEAAAGGIFQNLGASVTAPGTLELVTQGPVYLPDVSNDVGQLVATGGAGGVSSLSYYNFGPLTVGNATSGVSATGHIDIRTSDSLTVQNSIAAGSVLLQAGGADKDLAINASLTATASATATGEVGLQAGRSIIQGSGAVIQADRLVADAWGGNVDLPGANKIGTLEGRASAGYFSIANASPLTISTISGYDGIYAGGDVTIRTSGVDSGIFIDQEIRSDFGSLSIESSKDVSIGRTGPVYLNAGANISITAGAGNVDLGSSYSSVYSSSGSVLVTALGSGGNIAGNGSFYTDGGAAGSVTLKASNGIAFDYIDTSGYSALDGGAVTLTAGGISGAGIYTAGGYGSAGSGGKGGSVTVSSGTSGVSIGYIATYGGGSDSGGGAGGNVSLFTTGTLTVEHIDTAGGDGGFTGAQGGNGGSVTLVGATINLVPPAPTPYPATQPLTSTTPMSRASTSTASTSTTPMSGIYAAGGWGGDNAAGNGGAGGAGGNITIRQKSGNLVLPDISFYSGGGWGGSSGTSGTGGPGGAGGNISITADAGNVTFAGTYNTFLGAQGGDGGPGLAVGVAGSTGQVSVAPASGGVVIAAGPVQLDGYWNNTSSVNISNSGGIRGWGPFINNGTVTLGDSGFVEAEVFENTALGTLNVISGTPHANLLRNDGAVNIASGAMLMTPSLSNYGTISGNGTLKVVNVVNGVIGGPGTFDNYAALKPGGLGAVGALTIDAATVNFSSGTNLYLDIGGTSNHDVVNVTGDVNLAAAGITATVNTGGASIAPGDAFNIIQSAAGTVSGTAPPAVSGFSFEVTSGPPQTVKAVVGVVPTPAPTAAPTPTAAPQTTTTVEKIVELLGTDSPSTVQEVQQAVAELDSRTLTTLDTLLIQEAETQTLQKVEEIASKAEEQKATDEKRQSGAVEENQCKP